MYRVNVEGTRILLEESKRVGVKAFVYTSSASVISDNRTDLLNADERYTLIRGALQSEFYTDTKVRHNFLPSSARTMPVFVLYANSSFFPLLRQKPNP